MRGFLKLFCTLLGGFALLLGSCETRSHSPQETGNPLQKKEYSTALAFARGMTVSCPTYGPIWGSPHMESALRELSGLGVEWAALHPYAHISKNGAVSFRGHRDSPYLARAMAHLNRSGLKVFWKPHLSYWGSFAWRGDISFDDEEDWKRFFETYARFILDQADFAEKNGIPIFSVGVELDQMLHRPEWRNLIAKVRKHYRGKITYAANWDKFSQVPFWEELDLIGVQAYFPLSDVPLRNAESIWQAWEKPLAELKKLSHQFNRPILVTEIGYSRSPQAVQAPWIPGKSKNANDIEVRRLLLDVAARRLEQSKEIIGLFWWKWIPGDDSSHRDFSMKDFEARSVLKARWGKTPEKIGNPSP